LVIFPVYLYKQQQNSNYTKELLVMQYAITSITNNNNNKNNHIG